MKFNIFLFIIALAFSQQGIAVVISSDKSRIEDSLQLSATIDLSDEIFLGTLGCTSVESSE